MNLNADRFVNREISLLDFQQRVLSLAQNGDLPLLERVKFLAIVSQNIDEFYQVRYAGLLGQQKSGVSQLSPDGLTAREQLVLIAARMRDLTDQIDMTFLESILPALEKENIRLANWADLDGPSRDYLTSEFEERIFPVLTPLAVDPSHPFPYISNLSLNLAVVLHGGEHDEIRFARVKVPPILPRFIVLEDAEHFVPLEQVISAHLGRLFDGQHINDHYIFRVTRNADLAVEEDEARDLLEAMESILAFRQRSASAVRLEVEDRITDHVLELLMRELELEQAHVTRRVAPLDLGGLWALYGLDRPELKDEPWIPTTQARLTRAGERLDLFDEIRKSDLLVHLPYESFATSTGAFLAQAAADPDVLAIKQTLYRTSQPDDPALGGEQAIVESLVAAAQAGKQVVVLVELKARFDEAANIRWAKLLEDAGAHVAYGVSGLKTHAKILLVVRREQDGLRRYINIGTGNYNPNTARIYEDLSLFTADPELGADLSELFNALTGYSTKADYRRMLVAPLALRKRVVERIRMEAERGRAGHILMKINHLVDPEIIDELYAASADGCRVELIVRGMTCLRPRIPGLSENITVRSIVGKFLEHSRIYRFGPAGDSAVYYIGSADMMQRNLDGRVESLTPVTDPRLKLRLEEIIQVDLADDELAWELRGDGMWSRVAPGGGVNAMETFQDLAVARSRLEPAAG